MGEVVRGLSRRGLKSIVIKLVFYEFFQSFQWIWGFRYSLKMSFKLCKEDFHEREKRNHENRGVFMEKKGEQDEG